MVIWVWRKQGIYIPRLHFRPTVFFFLHVISERKGGNPCIACIWSSSRNYRVALIRGKWHKHPLHTHPLHTHPPLHTPTPYTHPPPHTHDTHKSKQTKTEQTRRIRNKTFFFSSNIPNPIPSCWTVHVNTYHAYKNLTG